MRTLARNYSKHSNINPLLHNVVKWSDTHFKNLAANASVIQVLVDTHLRMCVIGKHF